MIRVIYGSSEDWINLRVGMIVEEQRSKGNEVRVVDGKTHTEQEISTALEHGLFDTDPLFVVIHNPTKLKKLASILDSVGTGIEVLVVQSNDRLPKALESYQTLKLDEPKYDSEKKEWASKFLMDIIEKSGYEIKENLALAVVKRVGTDLGVLRWEAKKYMMCVEQGKKEITPQIVSGCISELSEIQGTELVEAVAMGDMKHFLKICTRIETTSSTDQTMSVCNGLLLYNLVQWIDVGLRLESKQTATRIAEDLGKNPWFIENMIIPKVKRIGVKRIRQLLRHLYWCEDNVRNGGREPWVKFKAGVVKVFSA